MRLQFKIYIALAAALLVALSIFGAYRYGKRVADYAAHMKELETQLDSLKKENQSLKDDRKQIQASTSREVAGINKQSSQATTPKMAAEFIRANVPALLAPSKVEDVKGTQPESPSSDVNSPMVQVDVMKLKDFTTDYLLCNASLNGCKKELSNADQQIENLTAQNSNFKSQADLAKHNPKHPWLNKVAECGLRVGIGAAGGAVAKNQSAVALGGGIGLASCFVF
jgi:Sec-independent protein translocase protein TatA